MTKIKLYNNDTVIDEKDKVIGTDANGLATKNYEISDITSHISSETLSHPVILTGIIDASSDQDAADNGVPVGGVYSNSGQLFIRLT
jgi:hypothetical protein